MKKSLLKACLALVAMFCSVISANAANTYTGVTPEIGKSYYLYCPATGKFLAPIDNEDVWPTDNLSLVSLYWYIDNNNNLHTNYNNGKYYLSRYINTADGIKEDERTFVAMSGKSGSKVWNIGYVSFTKTKSGNYYTLEGIEGDFVSFKSQPEDYYNFIFVAAPGPEEQEPVEETSFELPISAAKYATYYNSDYAYIMPDDCEGYGWTTNNTLEKAYNATETVPAGEPLVIYSATPGTKTLVYTTSNEESFQSRGMNLLEGTDIETPLEEDDNYYFYALTLNADNDLNSVGFYWMNDDGSAFTNGAHRAYLKIAKTAKAPMAFPFNNATAIANAKSSNSNNAAIFNIAGQRLNSLQKGINIVNGKKVLKK